MEESLPTMVDDRIKELTKRQVLLYVAQGLIMERQQSQADVAKIISDPIQRESKNLRSEITSQINDVISNHIPSLVDSSVRNYMLESSFGQDFKSEEGPSTACNHEQLDDFDFWTDSYAIDDDEIPNEKVSQELVDKMSHTVDEAKLRKVVDEMLRQQCTLGDEHQYHIDQMQNFLKNDIAWESTKEIIVTPHPQSPTLVVQSCQRDPKAPALSLVDDYAETGVESYQQKVNLTAPTITFPGIEKFKVFSIVSKPVYGVIYKNNKKENLNNKDAEYLQLFEEEIEERLKHCNQMRR
ncbi:hypothetical protein Tco_0646849 [Tanacetum coccineum]